MSTPAPESTPTVGGLVSIAPVAAAAPSGLPPLDTSCATAVLALQNMVTAEDQSQEEEMSDILEDTKSECEKHGAVRSRIGADAPPPARAQHACPAPLAPPTAPPNTPCALMLSPFTPPPPPPARSLPPAQAYDAGWCRMGATVAANLMPHSPP